MRLQDAIRIASVQHGDTQDKNGQPFIGHPLRVMANLAGLGMSEAVLQAAVLHDTVEDTDLTLQELELLGFHDDVVSLVDLLTRTPEQTYFEYIERIKGDSIATLIKLEDIADNMNPNRATADSAGLSVRYRKAIEILGGR